ncbi:MAG TPA: hypothetical protein VFA89_15610 [Terriglobales bacterium]|nr:hypothetical protein [Terriglobales bacterium]
MKRARKWGTVAGLLLALAFGALARKDETLEQLKARADAPNLEERINVCLDIAEREANNADQFYTKGDVEQGRAAVDDVASYSEKARDAATQSGKKLKTAEITVRKMAKKLRDMKRTLAFEDQGPVQAAVDRLESVRSDLLARMFGKDKKK